MANLKKSNLHGKELVVNTRKELCGAFINTLNVTFVNYTVKGKAKDRKKRE